MYDEKFEVAKVSQLFSKLTANNTEKANIITQIFDESITNNKIYNVDYKFIKETVSFIYSKKLDIITSKIRELNYPVSHLFYMLDISSYSDFGSCKKRVRDLKKAISDTDYIKITNNETNDLVNELLEIHEGFVYIKETLDSFKGNIFKGKKPPSNVDRFQSAIGNEESQNCIMDILSENIKDQLSKYETNLIQCFKTIIEDLSKTETIEDNLLSPEQRNILWKCFQFGMEKTYPKNKKRITYIDVKVNKDSTEWVAQKAKEQTTFIKNGFLSKNVIKLSKIVEQKGSSPIISKLPNAPVSVNNNIIEAGFVFKFNDDSQFTVINKIVAKQSYSRSGTKLFFQFPTTFHDVILSDGSKMKYPSEQKMVKEFI